MKKNNAMLIVSLVIIVMISIAFTSKAFQNDTFYTIKVGESILKHGIDMKDHFSWHTLSYTYPHWLYDIGVYKIFQFGGFHGLYLMTIGIFMITGLTFYFINLKRNKSYFLSLFFSMLSIIMIARFATARAQLVTYFLFILEIYLIEQLIDTGKKRYGFGLLVICLLIANLHAAVWPLYFVLMLPYLFEEVIACILKRSKSRSRSSVFQDRLIIERNPYVKYLFVVFLISLFVGLATPIGFTPYTYFIKIFMGDTQSYIDEHKPLILIQNYFVIAYLVIMFTCLIFTKVKIKLSDFVMILGLLFMSFLSARHVAILGIVGMFFLCRLVCNIGRIYSKKSLDYELPIFGLLVVAITVVFTSGFTYSVNSKEKYINDNFYPVDMVKWMNKNIELDKIKLYNEYDFGSYLIYKNIPVYIDSRSDLYTKPFNHKTDIFDECMKITEHYGRVFNKYGITHILIYKDTNLNQILAASDNYKLLHKEGRFMLYEYLGDETGKDKSEDV